MLRHLYLMAIPLLFLFVSSCNKQSNIDHENDLGVVETRTVAEFCDEALVPCSNAIISYIVDEIYVINGCTVYVDYTLLKCPNFTIVRDMSYTFANSAACNNTNQIWNQYYFNGQSQLANESINQFYKLLSEMIEEKIALSSPPTVGNFRFHFVETFCHTLCAKEITDGENPSFFLLSQQVCGRSCCIRTTEYIIKDGKLVKETVAIHVGGDCDPIPVDCNGDKHLSEICDPACARLE